MNKASANVYYLGPQGSFSNLLASQALTDNYCLLPVSNFIDIIEKIQSDPLAIGLLPLENSLTSTVHENIDSLFTRDISIVAEAYLEIRLLLLGIKDSKLDDIKIVYSHPKALEQCSQWIVTNNIKAIPCNSTSQAREIILEKNDKKIGMIGGEQLITNEITRISKSISNQNCNITRFVFVSQNKNAIGCESIDKLSFTFKAPHQTGALAKILTALADIPVNLTKIESKPIPGSQFEYKFWIDLEITPDLKDSVFFTIEEKTIDSKCTGLYSRGQRYQS